jgi:heme A synthase
MSQSWIRQLHRWVSLAFTVIVIVNVVCLVRNDPVPWVGYLALLPLSVLLLSGLYLFALPYVSRLRSQPVR